MIHKLQSDEALRVNLELIGLMYESILSLKSDIASQNFKNYLIFAEGPIERIRRLKAEIDDYLGIQEVVAQAEKDAIEFAATEEHEKQLPLPLPGYLAESSRPLTGESNTAPS
jgi:hypothetical protein